VPLGIDHIQKMVLIERKQDARQEWLTANRSHELFSERLAIYDHWQKEYRVERGLWMGIAQLVRLEALLMSPDARASLLEIWRLDFMEHTGDSEEAYMIQWALWLDVNPEPVPF
jgi:hypothetical protein